MNVTTVVKQDIGLETVETLARTKTEKEISGTEIEIETLYDSEEEVLNLEECVPQVELIVNEQRITFLCDTGETRTVLKETVKGAHPLGSTIIVRSANGGSRMPH